MSIAGIEAMRPDEIVFAMANPTPEVSPEELLGKAAVIATGRSDCPNRINNVLAFPGVFRGALDVRASSITSRMQFAAAEAIASVVQEAELDPDYIIPSVFNPRLCPPSPLRPPQPPSRPASVESNVPPPKTPPRR